MQILVIIDTEYIRERKGDSGNKLSSEQVLIALMAFKLNDESILWNVDWNLGGSGPFVGWILLTFPRCT